MPRSFADKIVSKRCVLTAFKAESVDTLLMAELRFHALSSTKDAGAGF